VGLALPSGAPRPALLASIENGIGATTMIEYSTAQYLAGVAASEGSPWSTFSPVVLTVVRKIALRNTRLPTVNMNPNAAQLLSLDRVVEYGYRDPAWDWWERRALGFRKVRMRVENETAFTQIVRWFGRCQQADAAMCPDGPDQDPDQAKVGLPIRIDHFSATGLNREPKSWLSSELQFNLANPLSRGPDGGSSYAYAYKKEILHFDTEASFQPGTVFSTVGDAVENPPRQAEAVAVTRTRAIDDKGNLLSMISEGRGPAKDML
jgi:Insecticide toxin TcdB middle/N-terminal region